MKYKDLCNKAIGDMNQEELYEFTNGLLEEVWNYEDKIDKAIEYIKENFDKTGICVSGSDLPYSYIEELLEILGDKENE